MARFDVHRQEGKRDLLLNCQSDFLSHLSTRFVIPLIAVAANAPQANRLNPVFRIGNSDFVLATNAAATLQHKQMGGVIASLAEEQDAVMDAIDMLLQGF